MMDSFVLLTNSSLAASRTCLQRLLASLNFTLDSKEFCWYKWKKWFLFTMAAAQAAENHGNEWGLTWYLWWERYTSTLTWTHSQNSLPAAETLSLKISSHIISLKWSPRPSQSAWVVISYVMESGIPLWVWQRVNGNWETTWSDFPNGGKAIVEQILASEEKNINCWGVKQTLMYIYFYVYSTISSRKKSINCWGTLRTFMYLLFCRFYYFKQKKEHKLLGYQTNIYVHTLI